MTPLGAVCLAASIAFSISAAAELRSRPSTSAWTSKTGLMFNCETTIGTLVRLNFATLISICGGEFC